MSYIERSLERKFLKMSGAFKVVMLTGARQVGKSTMLKHLAEDSRRDYVTMDSLTDRELANRDPALFFQMHQPPILIDEVQKAPALFEQIKILCDESDARGNFWLTGSQSKRLMKDAGDSLAGRIGTLRLYGLSQREEDGQAENDPLVYSFEGLQARVKKAPKSNIRDIFHRIWRGDMPDIVEADDEVIREYHEDYVATYLLRDAVDDEGIQNTEGFLKLLRGCAACTGQLLNYSTLANVAGVSVPTAKEWVRALGRMGVIQLVEPCFNNRLKRMIKMPKIYFCDTGLCATLTGWSSSEALMQGSASGHFFETYVVMNMIKYYSYAEEWGEVGFYRDTNQKEIDLIIKEEQTIHPFEIKLATNPNVKEIRKFNLLEDMEEKRGYGGIICMSEQVAPIDDNNALIPVTGI